MSICRLVTPASVPATLKSMSPRWSSSPRMSDSTAKPLVFLDQAHGDARHRPLQRHAGIHQRQRRAAHGRHRGRAVGLGDLRRPRAACRGICLSPAAADGSARQASLPWPISRRPGEPMRPASPTEYGREIVVQHEVLAVLALERVDDLLVLAGAERGDAERLRLAAGEQRRAMRARQDADLGDDRADGPGVAAVDAQPGVQDGVADDVGLQVLEQQPCLLGVQPLGRPAPRRRPSWRRRPCSWRAALRSRGRRRRARRGPAHRPGRAAPFASSDGSGSGQGSLAARSASSMIAWITGWKLCVAEADGAEHDVLGQLLRLGFHHQHAFGGAGDHQVELAVLHLLGGRVQDVLAVDVADAGGGDRAEERDAGQGQRGRAADHRDDVGVVLQVVAEHGGDDLHLVAEALGEQRADRAVDQAARPAPRPRSAGPRA